MAVELKGIIPDAPIFLVFNEIPNAQQTTDPKMAVLLPVTNYETFRDSLLTEEERNGLKIDKLGCETAILEGTPFIFVNRKNGYAVLSLNDKVAASFAKKYDGLDTTLDKAVAQRFMKADVSGYVDLEAVINRYDQSIKEFQETLEKARESNDKVKMETVKQISQQFRQTLRDSKALLVALELCLNGVKLHAEVEILTDRRLTHCSRNARPFTCRIWRLCPQASCSIWEVLSQPIG